MFGCFSTRIRNTSVALSNTSRYLGPLSVVIILSKSTVFLAETAWVQQSMFRFLGRLLWRSAGVVSVWCSCIRTVDVQPLLPAASPPVDRFGFFWGSALEVCRGCFCLVFMHTHGRGATTVACRLPSSWPFRLLLGRFFGGLQGLFLFGTVC